MIRVSVSHEPEWVVGRPWQHSWAETVDEGRLMVQAALADPTLESICFERHGGIPNPTHVNYLKVGQFGRAGYDSADEQRDDLAVSGLFDDQGASE